MARDVGTPLTQTVALLACATVQKLSWLRDCNGDTMGTASALYTVMVAMASKGAEVEEIVRACREFIEEYGRTLAEPSAN